jgi:hypothetical protein
MIGGSEWSISSTETVTVQFQCSPRFVSRANTSAFDGRFLYLATVAGSRQFRLREVIENIVNLLVVETDLITQWKV